MPIHTHQLSKLEVMTEKKYTVKAVRPCEGGRLVVVGHFDTAFSMEALCAILKGLAPCSERLGVARFFHEGCSITLYRSGRIDVHRVESEDAAIRLIDDIKPVIESAFIE